MNIPDSDAYRTVLEQQVQVHASRPVTLIIVDDIADWAALGKRKIVGNPAATSGKDLETGAWEIVLRRSYDANQVAGILSRIIVIEALRTLSTPDRFLRHLVLHELAHLENEWGQDREDDCDKWAYEKLFAIAI